MKNFILWNYERGTWQYDIFCLLIVAFIFLTPKTWFEKREKLATQTARRVVKTEDFAIEKILAKPINNLIENKSVETLTRQAQKQ